MQPQDTPVRILVTLQPGDQERLIDLAAWRQVPLDQAVRDAIGAHWRQCDLARHLRSAPDLASHGADDAYVPPPTD